MNYLFRIIALALIAGAQSSLAEPSEKPAAAAKAGPDLLRFINNDTLHGSFLSFASSETMVWKNPEAAEPIRFSTSKLHRIVLNRGKAHRPLTHTANVKLANGDVIPGIIISADAKTVVLETEHLGRLELPRNTIEKLSPSPFGGKLLYFGPLNDDGWKTLPIAKIGSAQKNEEKSKTEDKDKEKLTDWTRVGAAWYAGTDKNRYLVRENAMPDKCRLSFKLAWRGSLYAKVALHADFAPPEYEHKSSSQLDMAATLGHSYLLSLSNHSASLYSCTFDKDGKPLNTRLEGNQFSLGLSGKETADIELRIDRANKNIILFLDGQFKAKWNLGDEYAGKGSHFAFRHQRYNNAEIRLSDVVIAHWNGMKDSASSMKSAKRDVVLLNNGVDRFSGKFKELRDGKVRFDGTYGNEMSIPLDEVSEIHFATSKVKSDHMENPKAVYFYIYPHGRITGIPSLGTDGKTKLLTSLLGEVMLDARYINIIDFSHQNSLLDNWDDNF